MAFRRSSTDSGEFRAHVYDILQELQLQVFRIIHLFSERIRRILAAGRSLHVGMMKIGSRSLIRNIPQQVSWQAFLCHAVALPLQILDNVYLALVLIPARP